MLNTKTNLFLCIAILLGLVFSSQLAWTFYKLETKSITSEFEQIIDLQVASIERELTLNFEALYAIKGLFNSSSEVTADEFSLLSSEIIARHRNIQALEWIPAVSHAQRENMVESRRQQNAPHFLISERQQQGQMIKAKQRDEYFPVYYVEPFIGNEAAFGFDLASNPKRAAALNIARQSGQLIATSSITLVQETQKQKGFLAFLPIYNGHPTTVTQRKNQLSGFALGVFKINDLIDSANLHKSLHGINFTLIDQTTSNTEALYQNEAIISNTDIAYSKKIPSIGGREWSIIATPSAQYLSEHRSSTPIVIFLLALAFVSFGSIYTYLLSNRKVEIETAVIERTQQLNATKEELERITLLDGLTGVANRRHFDSYIAQEWSRAQRNKQPLSLIMIDIDLFKQFNDNYGHLAGDDCLTSVAQILKITVQRSSDLVARYGGEEFAIILPNIEDAYILAELCRQNIEKAVIPHAYSPASHYVTVSIGFSTIIPHDKTDYHSLIASADKALYNAKESGRNTVSSS